jgi:hypothetical protein
MPNPKVKSKNQIVVGPDADAFHFLDTKGNVIGWIDGTGELQGNLTTNAGTNTTSLQGNPIAPTPPQINQALVWNGAAYAPSTVSGVANINFSDNEIPSPDPDGNNTVFTLLHSPKPPSSIQLFINGILQSVVPSGNTINLNDAPQIGDVLEAFYRY